MSTRGRVTIAAVAAGAAVLTAGTAVAVTSSIDSSVSAGEAPANAPTPYGESQLPTSEQVGSNPGTSVDAQSAPEVRAIPSATGAKIKRTFQIKTKDPVFFITVDDGNTKSPAALNIVRKRNIPVTVFLTNASVAGQWSYFKEMASFGGSVENHTMTHRSLTSSSTPLQYEICRPQSIYAAHYGRVPTMLRPPYGNGGYANTSVRTRKAIDAAASSCGVRHVVMWNGLAENGRFQFIRGSLKRGDIVLFHFTPSLAGELKSVMRMAKAKGLHPASLTDYLR